MLLFLSIVTLIAAESSTTMMIVFGEPPYFADSTRIPDCSWDKCIDDCASASNCVLAEKRDDECVWYRYDQVSSVTQMNKEDGKIVAFKSKTGYLETEDWVTQLPVRVNYTITSSDTSWEITYNIKTACPTEDFDILPRSSGDWCLAVYFYNGSSISYDEASESCEEEHSVLTGPLNDEETDIYKDYARMIRSDYLSQDFYVRVDGKRKSSCESTPDSDYCKSSQGFDFLDPHANLDFYPWAPGSGPEAKESSDDNCVVLVVTGSDPVVAGIRSCETTADLDFCTLFCGVEVFKW